MAAKQTPFEILSDHAHEAMTLFDVLGDYAAQIEQAEAILKTCEPHQRESQMWRINHSAVQISCVSDIAKRHLISGITQADAMDDQRYHRAGLDKE